MSGSLRDSTPVADGVSFGGSLLETLPSAPLDTGEVSGSFSLKSLPEHPHPATKTLPCKSSPINQATMWFERDARQTEQAACHDKNSPFDQTASPFYLRYSKEAALTSLTLSTFGPTGERWGASVKHCNPHHASAKSFLQRWAHANSAERLCLAGCVGLWTVDSSLIEFCCECVRALSAYSRLGCWT